MLPEVETLLVVQDRDQKIRDLEKDLKVNMPNLIARATARLDGDKARVAGLKEQIQANEIAMKTLELDIQTRRDTINKLKHQQFETKKNEEYRALGHEVERYTNDVTNLEDQELELMEVGEDLSKQMKEANSALARTQELVDEELAQLATRKKNEEEQIASLRAERDQHAAQVNDSLLSVYTRLFAKKQDIAVAPLESLQCKGCHMKVTQATAQKAKAEKEVTNCENCGRILYAVE